MEPGHDIEEKEDVVIATREGDAAGPPSFIFRHFLHREASFGKLATREDPQHLHKTLGVLSLVSFIYRYGYVYPWTGTLGFDGPEASDSGHLFLDWATMLIHTALAFSSIIFRVPRKRISKKPMVIYEEYRQHAMVFTLRCFLVFSTVYAFPGGGPAWLAPMAVLFAHLMADRITSIHGTPGNTAVRATEKHMELSTFYRCMGKLYSLYQFLAIGSHILPNARLADLGFNAIIAIQSSAFLMTLYRKRIIRGKTHMLVYSGCLVLSTFHIVRLLGLSSSLLVLGAFLARVLLPRGLSNKYCIWFAFLVAFNWRLVTDSLASGGGTLETFSHLVDVDFADSSKGKMLSAIACFTFVGRRVLVQKDQEKASHSLDADSADLKSD